MEKCCFVLILLFMLTYHSLALPCSHLARDRRAMQAGILHYKNSNKLSDERTTTDVIREVRPVYLQDITGATTTSDIVISKEDEEQRLKCTDIIAPRKRRKPTTPKKAVYRQKIGKTRSTPQLRTNLDEELSEAITRPTKKKKTRKPSTTISVTTTVPQQDDAGKTTSEVLETSVTLGPVSQQGEFEEQTTLEVLEASVTVPSPSSDANAVLDYEEEKENEEEEGEEKEKKEEQTASSSAPLNKKNQKPAYPNITAFFKRLQDTGYDARLRPYIYTRPVVVTCSLYISAISGVSESDMDFTMDFYFRQTWTDTRIRWDMRHADDDIQESIMISSPEFFGSLWRPDSFFVNEKTGFYHQVTTTNTFIRIMPNGHVTQTVRLTIRALCRMHFKYFPLDHQRCPLFIESFSLPINEIQYKWFRTKAESKVNDEAAAFSRDATSLLHFVINGFRTLDVWAIRQQDGFNHSRLVFDIYLARNLGYYLIQIYIPSSLIVVCSWIAFWVPRNSAPARVTLGVTTVLTMVTFTNLSSKAGLPNISYLKAMDIYLATSFFMVFAALIEYAAVSYAEKRAKASSALTKLIRATIMSMKMRKATTDYLNDYTDCYVPISLSSRIEWASRFCFPTIYIAFNCIYWKHFLSKSSGDMDRDEGFVDFNVA